MRTLGSGFGRGSVSSIAVDVPAIAFRTERMKLVIAAKTECPACVFGQPGPTASVATEADSLGAGVAGRPLRGRTVQALQY